MDANERARKAAQAQRDSNTSTRVPGISGSNAATNSNKSIALPTTTASTFDKVDAVTNIAGRVEFDIASRTTRVELPNLPQLTVDGVGSSLKHTTVKDIQDIRNPGFTEDEKCDKATYERVKTEYEDAIRYQQLIVWANNYKGEEYKAIASTAKAYTQGLIAKVEIEKTYQQYLELAKQEHITTQKGVEYIAQAHKTATVQAGLLYTLGETDALLEKQRIKTRKAFEEAKQADEEFDRWLTSLKGKN
jgi:hypothetical protein